MIFSFIKSLAPWMSGRSIFYTYVKLLFFFIPIAYTYIYCKCVPTIYKKIKNDCLAISKEWGFPLQKFSFGLYCIHFVNDKPFRTLIASRLGLKYPISIFMFPLKSLQILTKSENIGEGFLIVHGEGSRIAANRIGRNCSINQDVSIISSQGKCPIVGNEVRIFAGAMIYGPVKIGNGAKISARSVVSSNVPPYSIVAGNPAKVIGFSKTPEEIIHYEIDLYPESERMTLKEAEHNYNKYYLSRLGEIKRILSL